MATVLKTTLGNAMLDLIATEIDADAGAGVINVYDGVQPATPETAVTTQVLLATFVLTDPVAAAASSKLLTFSTVSDEDAALATSTATWARLTDNSGDAVLDTDVTITGGGGGIEFNSVDFVSGKTVSITSFTIGLP